MCKEKKIVMIAGPNGAGKTSFAVDYLPNEAGCPIFVNADLIAAGLSPFQPETAALRAGRIMLNEIKSHVDKGNNFAFETTLSGKIYVGKIPEWQKIGYRTKLIFLSLPNAEMAIARVKARVTQGGHSVPDEVIRRRFAAGWDHFHHIYKHLVDIWIHYDNSQQRPILIEQGKNS